MIDERKQYAISVSNLNGAEVESVGLFAQDLEKMQQLSISLPNGFVITTSAFDDFLIANELVDYISPRINDIDYDDKASVKKASEEIMSAIKAGTIPDIISIPILQSYSGLSGFYDAFISIIKSPINEYFDERNYTKSTAFINISGKEQLLTKIKECWAQIFTVEALQYRGSKDYEGFLTQAVIVQKMLQAEVSGKLNTVDPVDNNINTVEIQAFFGLHDQSLWKDMLPDSYFVNKKTQEITEKKIVGQDWMLVRKGRTNDKNSIMKIPISKLWQKKQKLEDKYILALARYSKLLEDAFHKSVQADWNYEAGKIYIVNISFGDVQSDESLLNNEMDETEEQEIQPEITETPIVEKVADKKSIEEYVSEVEKMRQSSSGLGTMDDVAKVTVDIKPIEELQLLTLGVAHGQQTAFGLIHLVFTNTDYEDLTGDEIVVVKNINLDYVSTLNSSKGIIVQDAINDEDLSLIRVPVIHSINDAFDLFQENEVVTLRQWNAAIYLGAGKETEVKIEEKNLYAQEIETPDDKVIEVNKKNETMQPEAESEVEQEIVDQNEDIPTDTVDTAEPTDIEEDAILAETLPKTVTDFWQAYLPGVATVDLKNIDGFIVRVVDIIEEYDPKLFSTELKARLVEILNKINGKPVILVSAGRGKKLEEIVEAELDAIDGLRNKDFMRNLWYSFDNISLPDELIKLKKIFTAKGFRRSATFKLFLTVHSPQSIISLKGLLESDIDGVIIDLDLLFKEHVISTDLADTYVAEYIAAKVEQINHAKAISILLAAEEKIEGQILKFMVKSGLSGVALNLHQIYELKPLVAEIETVVKVENKKKRGRKRKEIDFGF